MKPSDNRRHELLKYLEDRANRTTSTTTAPPPYTTNPLNTSNSPNPNPLPMIYIPNSMYSPKEYDRDEPAPAAISITIDYSITITGDKNTVSVSSPRAGPPANDATNPGTEMTNTKDVEHGPEQMGQLATILINALKAQDLTEESGRKRPINVELKRGIVVQGVDDKVCVGDARSELMGSRRACSVCTYLCCIHCILQT